MTPDNEILRLAERGRRETRGWILDMCEWVIGAVGRLRDVEVGRSSGKVGGDGCPRCEERRRRATIAQRNWRARRRGEV